MGRFVLCVVALLAAALAASRAQSVSVRQPPSYPINLAAAPVASRAQSVSLPPPPPSYPINPPASDSPLQQQILRNYRSDLLQTQRELNVQTPSGLSRDQIEVTRQLNAVNPALAPAPPLPVPTPGALSSAPFQLR
jgi:hypothetical protein